MQIIETQVFASYASVINNINSQMQVKVYQLWNRQYLLLFVQLHGYVDSQVSQSGFFFPITTDFEFNHLFETYLDVDNDT